MSVAVAEEIKKPIGSNINKQELTKLYRLVFRELSETQKVALGKVYPGIAEEWKELKKGKMKLGEWNKYGLIWTIKIMLAQLSM